VTPGSLSFLGNASEARAGDAAADYERAPAGFVLRKDVGKKLWRRSGIVNKTFVLNGESRS